MEKTEILEKICECQKALTEIVNNSNVTIKKMSSIIKLKRDLQKIYELDFQIMDAKQQNLFNTNN